MKKVLHLFRQTLVIVSLLCAFAYQGTAQITMSTANCTITVNEVQMDIQVTNNSAADLRWNSTVLRMTVPATMIPVGVQTYTFNYVGGSDFPLSWPAVFPAAAAGASYTAATRLLTWTTGTAGAYNNLTCTAPLIAAGETKTIGRFSFKITSANFVAAANADFVWQTTSSCNLYQACAGSVTGYNQASGLRTLTAPCSLIVPTPCSSPTVNNNPSDQATCATGTTTFTGSFTGGVPVPALIWQVQTGGVGLFTDLTEAAPYSGTATGTLTITSPGIGLSTNRYRLKASNTCGDVFTTDALLTVSATPNAGTVSGATPFCISKTTTYTTDGDPGGVWSSSNAAVATVSASGLVTTIAGGTADITYTVTGGCVISSFKTITVTPSASLAGTAGGLQVCSSAAMLPGSTSFTDGSCNLIATVTPSGVSPVSGNVNSCVIVDNIVNTYHNIPYAQRHFDIVPATNAANATATVTLYFTQAEFDAFNLARGAYPALPGGPGDVVGIANIRITQFHGTGTYPGNYTGASALIDPNDANIIWNAGAGRWSITFNITGFSGFYLFTNPTTPLPISLLNFSGKNNGAYNMLQWTTSSEQNSSYFDLERSTDGINFVKAGTVNAAGNSNVAKIYNYNDNIASVNSNIYYYRLKMVETTGVVKYSSVVKIKLNSKGFNVEATPNPFTDQLRINIETTVSEKTVISLNDVSGRKMKQIESSLTSGNNALVMSNLAGLPAGVYLLTITTDSQRQTVKVVKQ